MAASAERVFVSDGAVSQDGPLRLAWCKYCKREVVWATSTRTGRKYLVNVSTGQSGARFYMKHNVHKCPAR